MWNQKKKKRENFRRGDTYQASKQFFFQVRRRENTTKRFYKNLAFKKYFSIFDRKNIEIYNFYDEKSLPKIDH